MPTAWTASSPAVAAFVINGKERGITGKGNGPIAAFADASSQDAGAPKFEVTTYREQSLSSGTEASALAFIQIKTAAGKRSGVLVSIRTSNSPPSKPCSAR
jgi:hypothetical protein